MRTIRTRDASAAAIQKFESMTGARCFVLDGTESPQVQALLDRLGIFGIVQDPAGPLLDKQQWRTSRATLTKVDIEGIFTEFCRIAGLLYNTQANSVHGAGVTGLYLELYRRRRGASPTSVFDIGFGYDPTGGMLAAALHRAKYSGVTMIPEKDRSTTGASLLHVLDVLRLGDAVRQSQGKLFWATPFGSGKLPKDVGQYQLVFSHTVLEHVVDLPAFLVDVRQVLAPGGCFISYVDLTGHELGDHPLDFLGWPQKQWDELIAKTIAGGNYLPCRRERLPWYLQQMQAAGFKVETEIKTRLVVPERIGQLFPGEDLTPEGVILYCDLA